MGRSVVVAIDGPSKSGSTFFGCHVEAEAEFQKDWALPRLSYIDELRGADNPSEDVETLRNSIFRSIGRLSAGNFFRALSLAQSISEFSGRPVTQFKPESLEDRGALLEFMAIKGIEKVLQSDQNIAANVSTVAQMPGALELCEAAFCDAVSLAYHQGDGDNLVIADARNPLDIFARRGLLGSGELQVLPQSIVPVYVDAPAEVAARWLGGDPEAKTLEILKRREADASRSHLPVIIPDNLTTELGEWAHQFYPPQDGLVTETFHLQNGERMTEANIQYVGGYTAAVSWDLHMMLNRQPVAH